MKVKKIKKNSIALWIARVGADYDPRNEYNPDRCTYVRKVAYGFMTLAFAAFILVMLLGAAANTVAWWIAMLLHGYVAPASPIPVIMTIAMTIIPAAVGFIYGIDKIKEARREAAYRRWREADGDVPEGFLTSAWKSFKEKTCVRIEVED